MVFILRWYESIMAICYFYSHNRIKVIFYKCNKSCIYISIGYLLWGKKKKPIDNVARFKELTIIKLYSKIDECRSKFNRMMLAPSSGSRSDSNNGVGESDSFVTDWDRSRESLNGISEGMRGYTHY